MSLCHERFALVVAKNARRLDEGLGLSVASAEHRPRVPSFRSCAAPHIVAMTRRPGTDAPAAGSRQVAS